MTASVWSGRVGLAFGVLAFVGAVLWCVAGAGVYGSPLAGMNREELLKVSAFLLVGPLSVLPAAILSRRQPCRGGLWLAVGGLLSGYLILFSIPHPNLKGGLHFETVVPLVLVSLPMLALGMQQMVSCRARRSG